MIATTNAVSPFALTTHTNTMKPNVHYNNAKYEGIMCQPIKPTYDGSHDMLIPFLNCLDLR